MALTEEDFEIWLRWSDGDNGQLFRYSRESDRADADIIRTAQQFPRCTLYWPMGRRDMVRLRGVPL
jgi:hypothetical protein